MVILESKTFSVFCNVMQGLKFVTCGLLTSNLNAKWFSYIFGICTQPPETGSGTCLVIPGVISG